MKYKLLATRSKNQINLGDYIQSLAASQFLPSIDGFIQREKLDQYSSEEATLIMNGWFMHEPENWPPSPQINPIFLSFHLNILAKDQLLSEKSVAYFKKHKPIGCRDFQSVQFLKSKNVDAYFSGCLTLTLGEKYFSKEKEDICYFVDPLYNLQSNIKTIVFNVFYLFLNWKDIKKIDQKFKINKTGLSKKIIITAFYRTYIKIFSRDTLINAEYINHTEKINNNIFKNDVEYLNHAEELVKKYAKAKLVVTSRIHCTLPCLGLQTPVLFIEDVNQSEASKCRMGGLVELFNRIQWDNGKLIPLFKMTTKISLENYPPNKIGWKKIADKLKNKCSSFLNR